MEYAPSHSGPAGMDLPAGLACGRDGPCPQREWWAARGFLQAVAKAGTLAPPGRPAGAGRPGSPGGRALASRGEGAVQRAALLGGEHAGAPTGGVGGAGPARHPAGGRVGPLHVLRVQAEPGGGRVPLQGDVVLGLPGQDRAACSRPSWAGPPRCAACTTCWTRPPSPRMFPRSATGAPSTCGRRWAAIGTSPFALYKLVALHAAAHERFGTFAGGPGGPVAEPLVAGRGPALGRHRPVPCGVVTEDFRIDVSPVPRRCPDFGGTPRSSCGIPSGTSGAEWRRGAAPHPAVAAGPPGRLPFGVRVLAPGRSACRDRARRWLLWRNPRRRSPEPVAAAGGALRALVEPRGRPEAEASASELDLVRRAAPPVLRLPAAGPQARVAAGNGGGDAAVVGRAVPGTAHRRAGQLSTRAR